MGETEDFSRFSASVRGAGVKNRHAKKVSDSWGVYDYYKYYRKAFPKGRPKKGVYRMDCGTYYKIIRTANKALAEILVKEGRLELPNAMGVIEITKFPTYVKFVNGKLKTNRAIKWTDTLKLWYEDKEAYDKKIVIRDEREYGIKFRYRKVGCTFPNYSFYEFDVLRCVRRMYNDHVENGGMETPYFIDIHTENESKINTLYNG